MGGWTIRLDRGEADRIESLEAAEYRRALSFNELCGLPFLAGGVLLSKAGGKKK